MSNSNKPDPAGAAGNRWTGITLLNVTFLEASVPGGMMEL